MGVTDFALERTCPEKQLNLSKWGFVSEEDHSGCKSQNNAIILELWRQIFLSKYGLIDLLGEFIQLIRLLKEQVNIKRP